MIQGKRPYLAMYKKWKKSYLFQEKNALKTLYFKSDKGWPTNHLSNKTSLVANENTVIIENRITQDK